MKHLSFACKGAKKTTQAKDSVYFSVETMLYSSAATCLRRADKSARAEKNDHGC